MSAKFAMFAIEHLMAGMAKLADMEIVADNWQGVYDAWRAMERLWDVGVLCWGSAQNCS